jgi:hypothetical protein
VAVGTPKDYDGPATFQLCRIAAKEVGMKQIKHWQDPANALVGAWLMVSPWVLGFQGTTVAVTSTVAIGTLLFAASVGAMTLPQAWEEWMDVALGVLLVLVPWLLGFDAVQPALQNALFSGLAITILALWVLATDDEYGGWWHRLVG